MPLSHISGHTFMRQGIGPDSVVLDLGAHYGSFSREMIARYGCRCVAVEGNPVVSAAIPADARLTVLNSVVAAMPGQQSFFVYDRLESSSLIPRYDRGPASEIPVQATTLAEVLARAGIADVALVKIDIEGAEIGVLDACPDDLLSRIPQITVEFHDFNGMVAKEDVERVIRRLRLLGFDVISMWLRSHGDTLFVNRRSRVAGTVDLQWSRWVVRNWWWSRRFMRRLRGDRSWPSR